jgi:hypothetical protein
MAALCLALAFSCGPARAQGPYVDGISDQGLPAWDGGSPGGYFRGLFTNVWVAHGHIKLARYVMQWNLMSESSDGPNPHGDYRERFEAWVEDVGSLGLQSDVALTSYDDVHPKTPGEYQLGLKQILDRARAMGHPVQYVEAWNEPNNQGRESARKAAQLTNSAHALCEQGYGCTIVAGNLEDSPNVAGYEKEYERDLNPLPTIWGVHPYYSVEQKSEAPLLRFIENLPHSGAGDHIWFTEIAARVCTNYRGNPVEHGESGQAERARWLMDALIHNRKPDHVFYFVFLLAQHRRPSCSTEPEDEALYRPTSDPAAPDAPRPAASYIWGGKAGTLPTGCGEPLAFSRQENGESVAIGWSDPGEAEISSLAAVTAGCPTLIAASSSMAIP